MHILLPPSETKAIGGSAPALDLAGLAFGELTATRVALITSLRRLAADLPAARAALKVTASKDGEIAANASLLTAPCLPALQRYTGVLYDALGAAGMSRVESARAHERLLVTSALFGLLAAGDRIPLYRLSAGTSLPGAGTMAARWREPMGPVLAGLPGLVVDLRSGAYAAFGAAPAALTVRVLTERADGTRSVVSHFNKSTKGRLARVLAVSRARLEGVDDVIRVARRAGFRVERTGDRALDVIT